MHAYKQKIAVVVLHMTKLLTKVLTKSSCESTIFRMLIIFMVEITFLPGRNPTLS